MAAVQRLQGHRLVYIGVENIARDRGRVRIGRASRVSAVMKFEGHESGTDKVFIATQSVAINLKRGLVGESCEPLSERSDTACLHNRCADVSLPNGILTKCARVALDVDHGRPGVGDGKVSHVGQRRRKDNRGNAAATMKSDAFDGLKLTVGLERNGTLEDHECVRLYGRNRSRYDDITEAKIGGNQLVAGVDDEARSIRGLNCCVGGFEAQGQDAGSEK